MLATYTFCYRCELMIACVLGPGNPTSAHGKGPVGIYTLLSTTLRPSPEAKSHVTSVS